MKITVIFISVCLGLASLVTEARTRVWCMNSSPSSWDWSVSEENDGSFLIEAETDNRYRSFTHRSCKISAEEGLRLCTASAELTMNGFMLACGFGPLAADYRCHF